ncbi:MAG: 2-amino-4-hydroxy-6-hydroxymethyldihydropteridine diphosphokinase [Planctomycetota bacterium]|nr:MAG: 2-amino-4-hydroxy-6-hydroxymethyldihydropteridine diphosphokinase [Planctomycetota bacterium]
MTPSTAHIGIGSNLGDRASVIADAMVDLAAVDGIEVLTISPLIETDAVGGPEQPRFLNGAAALRTVLPPRRLLAALHRIEASHGRDRVREQLWGPRRLDLDLLFYDDLVIAEEGLTVPHPRLHERSFVLHPLAIIAPRVIHPILRVSIECLRDRLVSPGARNTRPGHRVVQV